MDTGTTSRDGRVERGNQTRRLVLRRTADLASVEGLGNLTIGRLATELSLSKSGVFALFGSKEELQLATIRAARRIFFDHVIEPAVRAGEGLTRLRRMAEDWLTYSQTRVFPGGCFFVMVGTEFGSRPGTVHDAIASARREWVDFVEASIGEAIRDGEIRTGTDVPQLSYELLALMESANTESLFTGDMSVYDRARRAVARRVDELVP